MSVGSDQSSAANAPAPGLAAAIARRLAVQAVVLAGLLALGTAIAAGAGAPNLGTALSFGAMTFSAGAVFVMLRR